MAHSLEAALLHPAVATLFAFGGVALGVVLRKVALHRLSLLVAAAMGTLLAVTLFDVLPEARQSLPWPALIVACASGYLLLWAVGKYVYHICPACAIHDLEEASPQLAKTAGLLMAALGLHCIMDGLGIVLETGSSAIRISAWWRESPCTRCRRAWRWFCCCWALEWSGRKPSAGRSAWKA